MSTGPNQTLALKCCILQDVWDMFLIEELCFRMLCLMHAPRPSVVWQKHCSPSFVWEMHPSAWTFLCLVFPIALFLAV